MKWRYFHELANKKNWVSGTWRIHRTPFAKNTRWFNLSLELDHSTSIKMDDQFELVMDIAVSLTKNDKIRSTKVRFYFFWKKTLDWHVQKTVDGYCLFVCLFIKRLMGISRATLHMIMACCPYMLEANGGFRHREMYDVKAGTCSRKMRRKVKHICLPL